MPDTVGPAIQREKSNKIVTILSGQSVSDSVFVGKRSDFGIILNGSAWTAADLGIQVSHDGTTFVTLTDVDGNAIRNKALPTGAAWARPNPCLYGESFPFSYVRFISLNTGTGAAENQGANRSLIICVGS